MEEKEVDGGLKRTLSEGLHLKSLRLVVAPSFKPLVADPLVLLLGREILQGGDFPGPKRLFRTLKELEGGGQELSLDQARGTVRGFKSGPGQSELMIEIPLCPGQLGA